MTVHSRALLESWVHAFKATRPDVRADIHVLVQDATEGGDHGLVEIKLINATTVTVVEPASNGSDAWTAVFEPRTEELRLSSRSVVDLAREITIVGDLCAYLETRAAPPSTATPDGLPA